MARANYTIFTLLCYLWLDIEVDYYEGDGKNGKI